MAQWLSWLERRPVTAEVESSSLFWVVYIQFVCNLYGVLAQLGEHLPYKQRVTGSSPVGPIFLSRSGGIGRRKGLKILREQSRTGSSPVCGIKSCYLLIAAFLFLETSLLLFYKRLFYYSISYKNLKSNLQLYKRNSPAIESNR